VGEGGGGGGGGGGPGGGGGGGGSGGGGGRGGSWRRILYRVGSWLIDDDGQLALDGVTTAEEMVGEGSTVRVESAGVEEGEWTAGDLRLIQESRGEWTAGDLRLILARVRGFAGVAYGAKRLRGGPGRRARSLGANVAVRS
jgi:hypothetical protein